MGVQTYLTGPRYVIPVVANFSALPNPAISGGKFFWCENAQGTSWLPGSLGGTYRPKGLYYSNGVSWNHQESAAQATQAQVDAGTNNDRFVTALTLKNAAQWDTKLNVADLPSTLVFYPTTASSPISGYYRLVTDINDVDFDSPAMDVPTGSITTTGQLIAELASDAGVLIGNPGVVNMVITGNIRRTTNNGTADFYYEVYHRDSGGTETLIATSSNTATVVNMTYEQFYAPALINNGTFTATDRLVFKFYANKTSSVTPEYELQFGGTQPIRAVFPVPFNVLPVSSITISDTGVIVDFATAKIFNSPSSPATGNITDDLTGAKIGVVQKIYHNDSVAPTFPVGWVRLGTKTYQTSVLNIIFAEWVSGTRVEYWITQQG